MTEKNNIQRILQNNGEICNVFIHKKTGTAEYIQGEITLQASGYTTEEAIEGLKELIKLNKELEIPK